MTIFKLAATTSPVVLIGVAVLGASGPPAQGPGRNSRVPASSSLASAVQPPMALAMRPAAQAAQEVDPMTSYSFTVDPNRVREYTDLSIKFGHFQLTSGPVVVAPIDCSRGTTGVMIIGNGKFQFAPEKGKSVEGVFRSAMLRFNPADQDAIISLDKGKKVKDVGAAEMSRHMLATVMRHCYQSSKDGGRRIEVLIPPKGSFAAVLYSKEHGDLLVSDAGQKVVVFSFTARKTLYERE